jgi:aminoglycoside 6'-N-acetyltransferase I
MTIETISNQNLEPLTKLTLALWTGADYDEELKCWEAILHSTKEICFLAKNDGLYVGFIHLAIRNDYVEGAENNQTAYLEALYIKDNFRNLGIAKRLLEKGEEWAKSKGLTQIASDTEIDNLISIEFHNKVGFIEANRIVCFIKNL